MARKDDVKHARDNVITKSQRNMLVRETTGMDQITIYLMAFGGMRIGEVAHMRSDWVHIGDEVAKEMGIDHIQIPKGKIPCDCVLCLRQAYFEHVRRKLEHKEGKRTKMPVAKYRSLQKKFVERKREGTLPALKVYWSPKTEAGKRFIPIVNEGFKNALLRWFKTHDRVGSYQNIYNRVKKIGRNHFPGKSFHPHALRATAATVFANANMSKEDMTDMMGWADFNSAQPYIEKNKSKMIERIKELGEEI